MDRSNSLSHSKNKRVNSQSVFSFWLACQITRPLPTGEESGNESGCPLENRGEKMSETKGHKSNGESELALSSKVEAIVDKNNVIYTEVV